MDRKLIELLILLLCDEGILEEEAAKKVYKKLVKGGDGNDSSLC